jgi:hypothetical protein
MFDEFGDVQHEFVLSTTISRVNHGQVRVLCSHDDFFAVAVELQ